MAEFPAERCYEVVVVGAGIQGSATAYYLTQKLGIKNVLLLEQVLDACFGSCNVVEEIHRKNPWDIL